MITSIGGYTCSRCGGFIPNGTIHHCPSSVVWQNPPPPPPTPTDERIAAALERIAKALEDAADPS